MKPDTDRFRSRIRQVHLDFHTPDSAPGFLDKFSAEELVRTLRDARVEGIRFFAKCHYGNSYYFTEAGKRHPQLTRDLLRETAQACRRHDLLCYAYYSVLADQAAGRAHPEWLQRDHTGEAIGTEERDVCPNTPYTEELFLSQIKELTAYPVDGFFLDTTYLAAGVVACLCEDCRRIFRAETGLAMSRELFLEKPELLATFRHRSVARMLKKAADIRDQYAPSMVIIRNHGHVSDMAHHNHDGPPSEYADVGCAEVQPLAPVHCLAHEHYGRLFAAKDLPFELIPVRFMYGWGENTLKPLAQMNYENALIVSYGGVINHGDHLPVSGALDEKVYERVGKSFRFIEEREKFVVNTRPARYAAVLHRANDSYWNRAAFGAERILSDAHVQTDVIDRDGLDKLDRYQVLIVPDRRDNTRGAGDRKDAYISPIPRLRPDEIKRIAAWAKAGGRLIAEGNAFSSEGPALVSGELLGVEVGAPVDDFGYLYGEDEYVPSEYRGFPLQVRSPFHETRETTARRLLGWRRRLMADDPKEVFSAPNTPPAGAAAATGAVFRNRYGRGEALYFAFPVFLDFAETRHPWLKEVFLHLAQDFLADRPVAIDGCPSLRANLREAPDGTLFLDLLFAHTEPPAFQFPPVYYRERYAVIEAEYPLAGVGVTVRCPGIREVSLEPAGTSLEFRSSGDGVSFTVPEIRTWSIVRMTRRK